jgi:vesicle coat complex subunit
MYILPSQRFLISNISVNILGYAASCCLLREGQELCLLLINTLVRDLSSSNLAVIGLALSALCSAPLPTEAIPTLLPVLRDRLAHPTVRIAFLKIKAAVT